MSERTVGQRLGMTSRERVLCALERREPDRVPIDFGNRHTGLHVMTHRALLQHLGLPAGEEVVRSWMMMVARTDPRLMDRFQSDVVSVWSQAPDAWRFALDKQTNTWRDEWGIVYYMPPDGYYFDVRRPPLAEAEGEAIRHFPFPDPADPGRVRGLRDKVLRLRAESERAVLICAPIPGPWEFANFLLGIEHAYLELALEPDVVGHLAARIAEWNAAYWDCVLGEVGDLVDVIQIGDDLGGQNGPLFAPATFRRHFKPGLARIVAAIKRRSRAKVYLHSDGSVYKLIPDFIDCGVDAVNPVQVSAADMGNTARLKREFGGHIGFWGAGCDNVLLATGTPQEVAMEVRRRLTDLAPGGGLVFGSIHNMQPNVPPENIVALYDTALAVG
ncbi:MAG: uroporphyrinogen decarboxylase family protein [Chloroflexota bacterium]